MRRPGIARRIALIAAAAAAITALVSAAVPLVLLGFRLTSADLRSAGNLAAAMDEGITKERAERPTAEGAAREFLYELALDGVRREVWGPSGLIAAKGPGDEVGAGGGAADEEPHREKAASSPGGAQRQDSSSRLRCRARSRVRSGGKWAPRSFSLSFLFPSFPR